MTLLFGISHPYWKCGRCGMEVGWEDTFISEADPDDGLYVGTPIQRVVHKECPA